MTNKTSVVVVQDTGHDFSKAEKFGVVKPFIIGPVNVFSEERIATLIDWLDREFKDGDYLLMTGSLVLNCAAFSYLMDRFGQVNILVFHNGEQEYRSMNLAKHHKVS